MENRILMEPREAAERPAHDTATGGERYPLNPVIVALTHQVYKHLFSWPMENGAEDLKKAQWYLDRLIKEIEGEGKPGTPQRKKQRMPCGETPMQRQAVVEDFAAEDETEAEKDRFSKGVENILRYQVGVSQEGEE